MSGHILTTKLRQADALAGSGCLRCLWLAVASSGWPLLALALVVPGWPSLAVAGPTWLELPLARCGGLWLAPAASGSGCPWLALAGRSWLSQVGPASSFWLTAATDPCAFSPCPGRSSSICICNYVSLRKRKTCFQLCFPPEKLPIEFVSFIFK